jgi:hypothetical protein
MHERGTGHRCWIPGPDDAKRQRMLVYQPFHAGNDTAAYRLVPEIHGAFGNR